MKPIIFTAAVLLQFALCTLQSVISFSQNIAINTTGATPNASALLDVGDAAGNILGILLPRVALTATNSANPVTSPAISLMVYNTATAGVTPNNVVPGYYYWNGTKWISLSGGSGGNDWSLLGNAGTVDGTNFLGTTDNVALSFKVNNLKAGRIDQTGPVFLGYQAGNSNTATTNTGIGYRALYSNTSGIDNTANGKHALYTNTTGTYNTACGLQALYFNTIGIRNTASGVNALYNNIDGDYNTAIGWDALVFNTAGNNNTASGVDALNSNTTGNNNTASGFQALNSNTTGSNNTALGYFAFQTGAAFSNSTAIGANSVINASNQMVFGNSNVTQWGFGVNPSAGNAFQVGTTASNGNGAYLTNGGVWTNTSDRNKKENFSEINGKEILSKLRNLEITRWNYIGESSSVMHIGPMAQDFYELFNLGNDDKSISTIDPAGIALAAIKEQQKIIDSQQSAIDKLNVENKSLKSCNNTLTTQIINLKSEYDSRIMKLEEIIGLGAVR